MKSLTLVVAWLLTASMHWLPIPAPTQRCPFSAGPELHGMTPEAYGALRRSIAADVATVALDPAEAPVFPGGDGRARTALLMMAIARYESGYDPLVDRGQVFGPAGEVCIMQVLVDARYDAARRATVTAEGWTRAELGSDRLKCLRAALHKIAASARICGDARSPLNAAHGALVGADLLSLYTSGRCSAGSPSARHRYELAEAWRSLHPAPSASTP
jgi:hypothetical protein